MYPPDLCVTLREQQIETTQGGTEMKKYAITSICTLVLSLLGAFGLNQNSLNSNANSIPTETVENIQNIEDNQSLSGDNQTNAAEANAPAAEVTVNDVANDKENKKDIKDSKTVVNEKVQNTGTKNSKTDSNAKAADVKVQNTNNAVQKADKTNTQVSANNQTKAEATPVASSNNNVNNNSNQSSIKNGQVYYENINLSNCKSTSDVVKVLNNNGYQNITVDNIKNVKSLEDVLAYVNNNNSSKNNSTANNANNSNNSYTAPTTAPAKQTSKNPDTNTSASNAGANSNTSNTSANTGLSGYASEVLRLVNVERAKAGLGALTTNSTLTAAANKRAQETKQSFSHTRPNGTSCFTVLGEYGISYRTAGENIAYGQKTPQEVVNGWMNSPGHRANILKSSFGKVGIGVYESNGVIYWTQLFTD